MPGQQDVQRDLVRRLLALGALDQAIIRSRNVSPGSAPIAHHDAVGEHAGAPGHGRAVAAALADDRRGLAGDGRLVDRRDALDHLAVAGDDLARPRPRPGRPGAARGGDALLAPVRDAFAPGLLPQRRAAQSAWALPRPSAIASAKLAKRTREPEPQRELAGEGRRTGRPARVPRGRAPGSVVSTLPPRPRTSRGLRTSRGSSLRTLSASAVRRRAASRADAAAAPARRGGPSARSVPRAHALTRRLSRLHQEVLDDRAERQDGEEGERPDDRRSRRRAAR